MILCCRLPSVFVELARMGTFFRKVAYEKQKKLSRLWLTWHWRGNATQRQERHPREVYHNFPKNETGEY